MGLISGTKKVVKPLVNVTGWMDLRGIKKTTGNIGSLAKRLFIPQKATRKETFDEALQRLNLTEKTLKQRQSEFTRLLRFMLIIAFGVLTYTGYLFYFSYYRGALVSTVVLFLVLSQAFRYHFWIFQIKQRKLGCTFAEWFYHGLLRK